MLRGDRYPKCWIPKLNLPRVLYIVNDGTLGCPVSTIHDNNSQSLFKTNWFSFGLCVLVTVRGYVSWLEGTDTKRPAPLCLCVSTAANGQAGKRQRMAASQVYPTVLPSDSDLYLCNLFRAALLFLLYANS